MIDKNAVGRRISALRKELGYSQALFAEKLNVSTQAVSKWETGLALPDVEVLLNISWISNTSINIILEGDEYFTADTLGVDRGLLFLNRILVCPQCRAKLKLNSQKSEKLFYSCENNHKFEVIDGVVYFGTREIPGEQWSLTYKNYDEYLLEQLHPGLPRYAEGDIHYREAMWQEIEKLRPRTIIDIACGTGQGIKYITERINWPVTVIMTDLSHRILKWNRVFYSDVLKNPYVDMVYLACDCSNLPISDNSVDIVFSNVGFESMQHKMSAGLHEAYRVLKYGAHAVYNISVVDDHNSKNTKKWIKLCTDCNADMIEMNDISQWTEKCTQVGFSQTHSRKIYGEMPAPEDDIFPFENMVLRWMGQHIGVSQK